jgi:hypothetical protein
MAPFLYIFGMNVNFYFFVYFVKSVPKKQDLKLDITELELAAEMVQKEEEDKQKMHMLNTNLSVLQLSDDEEIRYEYHTL